MVLLVLCVVLTLVAVGGVVGMVLRDSRYSRRISDEGSEFLQAFETAPPDRADD